MLPKFSICIPTKDRPERLNIFLKVHYREEFNWFISIEEQDAEKYRSIIEKYTKINFIKIQNDRGVGYARKALSLMSLNRGDEITMFSDDNARFDINMVNEFVSKIFDNPDVYWLGAYNKLYDVFFKLGNKFDDGIYKVGFACVVFAVRTNLFKTIQFEEEANSIEDNEFIINMMTKYFPDNHVYTYKKFKYEKHRHEAGGLTNFKYNRGTKLSCDFINKKYGFDVVTYFHDSRKQRFNRANYFKHLQKQAEGRNLNG